MIKLSVVIPAYNAERFIVESLNSVTAQAKSLAYEIIIVNDGSKDGTQAVCEKYIDQHPNANIKLFYQENMGVSVARNRGIAEATGEWITFLDADDCLLPDLFRVFHTLDIATSDIILGELSRGQNLPDCSEDTVAEVDPTLLAHCCLRFSKYNKTVRKCYNIDPYSNWSACAKLYRRDWIIGNSIQFPEGVFTSEDFVFLLHAFSLKPRVLGTNMKMYYYRANEQSVTHTYNPQIFDNYCKLFDYLEKNIAFEKNTEDLDAYMAERIVDCIRIYLSCHRAKPKDVLRKQLQVFDQAGHIQRILRSPIRNVFVGKKRRIVGTYWLIRMKLAFLISRKNNNENTTC